MTEGDDGFLRTYTPQDSDGCYSKLDPNTVVSSPEDAVCWWHMSDGRVLGCHDGMLLEYDEETYSPLGVVVADLRGKEVSIIDSGSVLVTKDRETGEFEVVQPNDDGSYWRKFQRNKVVRLMEKEREMRARMYFEGTS